jgi:hypothetical protein
MGTSASNSGPGSGVSFDPPWLDDIDVPNTEVSPIEQQPDEPSPPNDEKDKKTSPDVAPPARFRGARLNLGEYIKSGSRDSLRRSLGHYSKTGMGGAKNIANRMRVSTSVGSGLFRTLQSVRDGTNQTLSNLFAKLKADGADAYQYIDAIIESVCPSGGSLDEVSCQNSVYSALSDFLNKNPNVDISNLNDDSLWSLTASFLGHEAFSRIQLDIGQAFENKQVSLLERMSRLKDMRDYVEAEISTQINLLRDKGGNQSSNSLQSIMKMAIENTFRIFEVEV